MKRVLVTGVGGALGQATLARLKKDPSCIIVTAGRGSEDLHLDLLGKPDFVRLLDQAQADLILHFAATFSNEFDEAYAANVEATRQLLEAAQSAGSPPRILLLGSAAEYGAVRPEENPIREDHVLSPVSIYGLSKTWQTQLAMLYASRGVDVIVARLFNLQGPGLSERLFLGRVQKQLQEVREGRRTELELGPLTAVRDYVEADDAAEQLVAVATHGQSGRIYHLGSGKPVTMRELLRSILVTNGLEHIVVRESATLSNRVGFDVPAIYADMTSTRQLMDQRAQSAAT